MNKVTVTSSIRALVRALQHEAHAEGMGLHVKHIPEVEAQHAPVPADLHRSVRHVLARQGIKSLYTHQTQAVHVALQAEHVTVATPTASGKSMCYNLPVLDALCWGGTQSLCVPNQSTRPRPM